jgi:hypothetical protein
MNKLMCMSNETIIIYSLNNNIRAIKDNCIKVYIFSGKSMNIWCIYHQILERLYINDANN